MTVKEPKNRRTYWGEQISKATKAYEGFRASGDIVVDKYRIEKQGVQTANFKGGADRYNILYSSTETIRPSLYAQTPKVEARKRHRDRKNPVASMAVQVIESCVQYALEDLDFDETMQNVIEDYTLPGMGVAWVRYIPSFKPATDMNGGAVYEEDGKTPAQVVDFEELGFDYIHWKDFLTGPARTWGEVPWVAKRVYMDKEAATERFGKAKAELLQYSLNTTKGSRVDAADDGRQAVIWEVWHKRKREVIWFSESYPDDLLDIKSDPLKLKKFFPVPKPLRAISNTRTMIPRCFYSQYQAQAEAIDDLTGRIRHLTNALQVRGVYDGSMEGLAGLLSPIGGNKMIPVDNWQQFVANGGMVGSIQWVPIKDIAAVLMQMMQARDAAKAEIYEITGFSDIVRGVSKASETLGAQEIKTDWASARLKVMQKEVQRFCRDSVRLMAEIISEHFTPETLAVYSGFDVPPEQPPQQSEQPGMAPQPGAVQKPMPMDVDQFKAVVQLLRSEKERCALIGVETDSTILPDEAAERKDRLEFLSSIGAFLQQAAPIIQQHPEMRGLLAGIMMFTVRTFRASRPIEQEFERFQAMIEGMPAQDPNAKENASAAAAAQATLQAKQAEVQANVQIAQVSDATEKQKIVSDAQIDTMKENNRHQEKMAELSIKERELQIKEKELALQEREVAVQEAQLMHEQNMAAHDAALGVDNQQHTQGLELNEQQHDQGLELRQQEQSEQGQASDQQTEQQRLELESKAQEQAAQAAKEGGENTA